LLYDALLVRRRPLYTNVSLLLAIIAQTMFIIYSLFSVDAFTTKVVQMVGLDPTATPMGLPESWRALLLALLIVNALVAVVAEFGCVLGLYGWSVGTSWARWAGKRLIAAALPANQAAAAGEALLVPLAGALRRRGSGKGLGGIAPLPVSTVPTSAPLLVTPDPALL